MKRVIMALAGMALLVGAFVTQTPTATPVASVSGGSSIEDAHLVTLTRTRTLPLPKAKFTRTMYAAAELKSHTTFLDVCHGPIAVDLGERNPVLVAEHDYCGGSAWIPKLGMGQAVALDGDGITDGTYQVTAIKFVQRGEAKVRDLPDADAVLQTCISKTEMVLVGIDRLEQVTVSS